MTDALRREAGDGQSVMRRLSESLADAFSADDVARATLTTVLELPGMLRAGIALNHTGGRELRFVSSDEDALTPTRVRWCLIDAFADVPLVSAVRQGTHSYASTLEQLAESFPGVAQRQRELGTASLATLSLSTEQERVGALMLSFGTEQRFGAEQRWLLGALSSQVTQALRKGIAYQVQHTTAEQLQRSLMPRSLPELAGLELGSHYRPGGLNSDVGGDWYDVIALSDGSVALALGDVMGKGTEAAVRMSEMRSALRAYVALDPSPATVLQRLDAFVSSQSAAEQIVTVAYGVVPPDRSAITLSLAGHPPPVVVSPGVGVEVLPEGTGSALGVGAGPWPETTVDLSPGRVLLLYSNGLVETRQRALSAGIDELAAHVLGIPERRRQPRELCARLAGLMGDDHGEDDVTLLAVAASPVGDVRRVSTRLPAGPVAAGEARRFVTGRLREWDVAEDTVDAAELCVSELVTNAVIHTGTAIEVSVHVDTDVVTVLVRDGGGQGTVSVGATDPDDDPLAVSGRGLGLVDVIATAWAAEHGADGTTVWFELERC